MDYPNVLDFRNRDEFRAWLSEHAATESECWLVAKRGRPTGDDALFYIDAVEEALCFGWIDSVVKPIDGIRRQRFSPRHRNGLWTELNKERVRRLEKLGKMTEAGRKVLPKMGPNSFRVDPDIVAALKAARCYKTFRSFPSLYQRVRSYNVAFAKTLGTDAYQKALAHLIHETKAGRMYGNWNDYGRLLDY